MRHIVIVGASVAGLSAADALREAGFDGSIVLVGSEKHLPYDRPPLSKQALAPGDARGGYFPLRDEEHYRDQQLQLLLGKSALSLDAHTRTLLLDDGERLPFDALFIATGCRANTLHTEGGETLPVLRTLDDAQWLNAAASRQKQAILIGAGFIGLEVAASLRRRGIEVTVLESAPMPLMQSLGTELSDWLCSYHAAQGVKIVSGVQVTAIQGEPGSYRVVLGDGRVFEAGIVLAGIGVRPNTEWLDGSGVPCTGGVLVDECGRTAVPGVLAAGDVASITHAPTGRPVRIEHWTHAVAQGRASARGLLLGEAATASPPYFWTDQHERKLQGYGRRQPGDTMRIVEGEIDSGEFVAIFGAGEAFHGVVSCGRARSLRRYRKLLEQAASWSMASAASVPEVAA